MQLGIFFDFVFVFQTYFLIIFQVSLAILPILLELIL